jgi:6-phosphogluconate dehydrogenase
MKTTIFAFCFLCATAAFGQVGQSALSNVPSPIVMIDHPQHASVHAMGDESSLLGGSVYSYAQGEQPLWEFAPDKKREVPLGDVARAYRQGHVIEKKAAKVSEN